jgi:hypothetical protein
MEDFHTFASFLPSLYFFLSFCLSLSLSLSLSFSTSLSHTWLKNAGVSAFEITIRFLGGLLTAYTLTGACAHAFRTRL